MKASPIRPTDDQARALTRDLLTNCSFAALAVIDPETQTPFVSRIAMLLSPDRTPMSLISNLAFHTGALRQNPNCSLLVGEPPAKGDPLAFPRVTLTARAEFISRENDSELREHFKLEKPKSKLYIGFPDFGFVLFHITGAALNGGFGKAYVLSADDLKK